MCSYTVCPSDDLQHAHELVEILERYVRFEQTACVQLHLWRYLNWLAFVLIGLGGLSQSLVGRAFTSTPSSACSMLLLVSLMINFWLLKHSWQLAHKKCFTLLLYTDYPFCWCIKLPVHLTDKVDVFRIASKADLVSYPMENVWACKVFAWWLCFDHCKQRVCA